MDYNGSQIKNLSGGPYVKNSSGTIGSAVLLWQDVNGLISSVSYDGSDNGYIKFYIPSATLKEGNAVISIKNTSGVVMWSWHIWATAADIRATIPVTAYNTSYVYNFMPVNLGWVSLANNTVYNARAVQIRISQEGGTIATTTISQDPKWTSSTTGFSPFYEFARNIPMMSWSGSNSNTLRSYYSQNGNSFTFTISGGSNDGITTLRYNIMNPNVYYIHSYYNPYYWNLWDVNCNEWKSTISELTYHTCQKTIYDPCPVGFMIPPGTAFTGFFKNGGGEGGSASNTLGYSDMPRGWYLYTNSSKTNTIFFPFLGNITYDGGALDYTDDASWTCYCTSSQCGPQGATAYCQMVITRSYAGNSRAHFAWGEPVRPITE